MFDPYWLSSCGPIFHHAHILDALIDTESHKQDVTASKRIHFFFFYSPPIPLIHCLPKWNVSCFGIGFSWKLFFLSAMGRMYKRRKRKESPNHLESTLLLQHPNCKSEPGGHNFDSFAVPRCRVSILNFQRLKHEVKLNQAVVEKVFFGAARGWRHLCLNTLSGHWSHGKIFDFLLLHDWRKCRHVTVRNLPGPSEALQTKPW